MLWVMMPYGFIGYYLYFGGASGLCLLRRWRQKVPLKHILPSMIFHTVIIQITTVFSSVKNFMAENL
jgi:hypothetical protein